MALDLLCTGLPHTDRVVEQVFELRLDWSLKVYHICNFSDVCAEFVTKLLTCFIYTRVFNVLLFLYNVVIFIIFTDVNEFEAGSDNNGTHTSFWKPHEWRYANKIPDVFFNRISQLH